MDELLAQLSAEEIKILAKEVDPDVSSIKVRPSSISADHLCLLQDNFLPPNERNNYECEKEATGPLDRKKLIEHINKQALETPDEPELEPFVKGKVRGKKVRYIIAKGILIMRPIHVSSDNRSNLLFIHRKLLLF